MWPLEPKCRPCPATEPRRCVRPVQRRSSTLAARNTPSTCSTVKPGLKGMELMDVKDLISLLSNWIGLLANRKKKPHDSFNVLQMECYIHGLFITCRRSQGIWLENEIFFVNGSRCALKSFFLSCFYKSGFFFLIGIWFCRVAAFYC